MVFLWFSLNPNEIKKKNQRLNPDRWSWLPAQATSRGDAAVERWRAQRLVDAPKKKRGKSPEVYVV